MRAPKGESIQGLHARQSGPAIDRNADRAADQEVCQLWDAKGSAEIETMTPRTMRVYAQICGWTLARAHARSGDAIAIASYLVAGDVFDGALVAFAELCADQNERDHGALVDAVNTGRIKAETGV